MADRIWNEGGGQLNGENRRLKPVKVLRLVKHEENDIP
jgi:hypothetical protein